MPVRLTYKPQGGEVIHVTFPADGSPEKVRVIPGQGNLTFVGKGKVVSIQQPETWELVSDAGGGDTPVEGPDVPRASAEVGTLMVDRDDLDVLHHLLASPMHSDMYTPEASITKTRNALLRKVSRLQESVKKPRGEKKEQANGGD